MLLLHSEQKSLDIDTKCCYRYLRGLIVLEACWNDGMAGRSLVGGGGSGPIGGGCLIGNEALPAPNLIELLLLVRGGNMGLWEGSIADAGSGILSRLLNPRRLERETLPLGASCVSSERC